jgi:predicted ArsR family transcriptional regulator
MHTKKIITCMLKRKRWTAPELARELETSPQAIRYHLGNIAGLQSERMQMAPSGPDQPTRWVKEYWLTPSP